MKPTSPAKQTRRQFVTASAVAAAAAPLGRTSGADKPSAKTRMREIETDVLVCGGGCAGTAAALSAARNGAKTLLIEKAPFAGGIITSVGLPFFDGIADIKTHRLVVKGIALELLSKSGICERDIHEIKPHNPVIRNTFEFKVLLDRELQACGPNLKVLFNSFACDAESSDGRVTSVVIANKDGLVRVKPKVVVDCTGDADVAARAGAPTEQNDEVQPLTLHFRVGHVKPDKNMRTLCRQALLNAQARGELPYFYGPGVMFL